MRARGWGWRHAGRRLPAVADLDLDIRAGERVLLLGPSGSGKSTLLHGLAGVLGSGEDGDEAGELSIDGSHPRDARGRAGLVLQDPESQAVMARVGDDVAFGCENLGVPSDEIWSRVREALADVGLDVPLDASTAELSGGQKQRLALAGALAMRPGLLLLDEPTANLDPEGAADVRDAVARVLERTGATLVVVEHRVAEWLALVHRVVVLGADGRVIADGEPDAVLERAGADLAAAGVWVPGEEPDLRLGPPPPPGDTLLSARDLAIARTSDRVVRRDIDADVAAGRVLAVTGPNGSGKSTLALTLAGLLAPAGGKLEATAALTQGIGAAPSRWRSRDLLTRIGMVFQSPEQQFLAATVRAELEVGPRALGLPDAAIRARVDGLLERLGLIALAGANPFTLSGGQQRRLSVGAAIATAPRVLVLDEPTFGQDARTWVSLVELLDELRRDDRALVAVTHDARLLDALAADRLHLGSS